jgi:hypothetical protein
MNSLGRGGGGVGLGVAVGGVATPGVGVVVGPAAAGAPGAGAAPLVAGRFGHPTRNRVRMSTGTTSNALPRRYAMSRILLVVLPVNWFT